MRLWPTLTNANGTTISPMVSIGYMTYEATQEGPRV